MVWLKAIEHLLGLPGHRQFNLTLAIDSPLYMSPGDFRVHDLVDTFLAKSKEPQPLDPLTTVAGTIFPANYYLRNGADGVYFDFLKDFSKLQKKPGSWGIYAERMLDSNGRGERIIPLQKLIEKMKKNKSNYPSAYEINVSEDEGFEIPLYRRSQDYNLLRQQPCLSHLSFKIFPENRLMLTVMYRSHYYVTKALGNLIGLSQLQSFVASETGLEVGPLICHSSIASIDTPKGLGIGALRQLVLECAAAYSE